MNNIDFLFLCWFIKVVSHGMGWMWSMPDNSRNHNLKTIYPIICWYLQYFSPFFQELMLFCCKILLYSVRKNQCVLWWNFSSNECCKIVSKLKGTSVFVWFSWVAVGTEDSIIDIVSKSAFWTIVGHLSFIHSYTNSTKIFWDIEGKGVGN